jgi:hypothetical protein
LIEYRALIVAKKSATLRSGCLVTVFSRNVVQAMLERIGSVSIIIGTILGAIAMAWLFERVVR